MDALECFRYVVPWRCIITDLRLPTALPAKYSIVPAYFSATDIALPTFSRKNHYYADKKEHERLKLSRAIEPLDESRRIWRFLGMARTADSVRERSSRVSTAIGSALLRLVRSEISRRRIEV